MKGIIQLKLKILFFNYQHRKAFIETTYVQNH